MRKYLFIWTAVAISGMMLSCSSSDAEEDLGETKTVVNMLSEPQYIQLTAEQRTFVRDNNDFTLKFLKSANQA
jgi:serpin B